MQNVPAAWKPRSPEQKELHNINVRISALKAELNRSSNVLENGNLSKVILKSIRDEIKFLKKRVDFPGNEARKIVNSSQNLKEQFDQITEIKGIDEKLALAIISDMPDVSNFKKAGQFSAFAGVTPSHFQSGSSIHGKSHISRFGSKSFRKVLYMSALVVKNHNLHFQKFIRKLQKKGKAPKVIIVAIMRKLMCILFGTLKNSSNCDSKLAFYDCLKRRYLLALTAIKHHPLLKSFAEKLREKGKKFKQIICAVMRKLVHIIFGILKYDVQKFKIEG